MREVVRLIVVIVVTTIDQAAVAFPSRCVHQNDQAHQIP